MSPRTLTVRYNQSLFSDWKSPVSQHFDEAIKVSQKRSSVVLRPCSPFVFIGQFISLSFRVMGYPSSQLYPSSGFLWELRTPRKSSSSKSSSAPQGGCPKLPLHFDVVIKGLQRSMSSSTKLFANRVRPKLLGTSRRRSEFPSAL